MLGKKSRPVIGILTGSLIPGNKTHSDNKTTQSPKGLKRSFDYGAVGLGIAAALESDLPVNRALIRRNSSRSSPIPVSPPRNNPQRGNKFFVEQIESESFEEEYTIVTRHSPSKPCTKVYGHGGRCDGERLFGTRSGGKSSRAGVFHISPPRFSSACGGGAPADDFLSSCHLCRKKLHGEDIYMYRGEKAFCSTECRYREIAMDERIEKCGSEATRAVDLSSSGYAGGGKIFTAGILAI
ncbi:hypothetical protein STAS_12405 [Striga asiatica]|uniref:FLZ-type domain-containing protein n=1 Tax=Striga asiatica TaxID=4170 RepID=A0A5A7PTA8_STRAF|nr:hypothetical protein STAS_12405 [Striga asiatica]